MAVTLMAKLPLRSWAALFHFFTGYLVVVFPTLGD